MLKRILIAAGLIVLFLIANRAAYKGYFHDDDLDNAAWTPRTDLTEFAATLVSPRFSRTNFRPPGHLYFRVLSQTAGMKFPPYVAGLQLLHLLNAFLVWRLLRKLAIGESAALAGLVFFLFHPATFDGYWQPMYVFDVLCALFSTMSLLFWIDRRWVWSFVCFWLAYKSKELAVMLPLVLLAYEWWLGERRWKPLIPFLVVSLSFGLQAIFVNRHTHDTYTFRFTADALVATMLFYAQRLPGSLWGWLAVALMAYFVSDRRVWFGISAGLLLLVPLLALPGRQFAVYLYAPLAFLAIAVAAGVAKKPKILLPVFLLVWIPFTYAAMREYRKTALTYADENRRYVATTERFLRESPNTTTFLFDGHPYWLNVWGIEGALRLLTGREDVPLAAIDSPESKVLKEQPDLAVLGWDTVFRKVEITKRDPAHPYMPFVEVGKNTPLWQYGEGWFPREGMFRWMQPQADARVYRPEGATKFQVIVNMNAKQRERTGPQTLEVLLDGKLIGRFEFSYAGWQRPTFDVPPGPAGVVTVQLRADPAYRPENDPRVLGFAVGGFGFLP